MDKPLVIPLRASAQSTTAATTTGDGVELRQSCSEFVALFDLSAIGDLTQAADTLDVYVDASHDGEVWFNIGRFLRITGVDSEYAEGTLTSTGALTAGEHAQSELVSSGACAPADYARNTLSITGAISDDETVVIGAITYRFKNTTTQAYDVKIGASDAITLDNLKAAINATGVGDGTDYHSGTVAHTLVIAHTNTDTSQQVVSRTIGTGNNALGTTETMTNGSWADTTLGGGTGASEPGVATTAATFIIGARTYTGGLNLAETFRLTADADQVLWETSEAVFLGKIKLAINAGSGVGTKF